MPDVTKYVPLGDEKNGLKLELTLDREVFDGKMVLPVVGQALVEGRVLLWSDITRVASPERLGLVELLVLNGLLLDLLGLLLLLFILVNFFDLRLLAVLLRLLFLLIIFNLL